MPVFEGAASLDLPASVAFKLSDTSSVSHSLSQSTTDISTFTDLDCATYSDCDSFSCDYSDNESDYDDDFLPMHELLQSLSTLDGEIAFGRNGYKKVGTICATRQGELYKAVRTDGSNAEFAIKRTTKDLFEKRIAVEDGSTFCVSDNCIKEAEILKRVTVDNTSPFNKHIVQYIDFFESDQDYYLVMEHVSSQTNLKQFIAQAKQHMANGKLSIEEYQKAVKQLMWQLFTTVQWLHVSIKCCHLKLRLENILVENASFITTKNGMIIDSNISIKLCDFGVSDLFEKDNFSCAKQTSAFDNDAYSAPKVFLDETYDGRACDNWRLGMILFECMTAGQRIYKPLDVDVVESGHWALMQGQLETYLKQNDLFSEYFDTHSFALLSGLLQVNDIERLSGIDILNQSWFATVYTRDAQQIQVAFST
eukprot:917957_1